MVASCSYPFHAFSVDHHHYARWLPNDLGNPFTDDSSDLYVIDTNDVKGKDVAKPITVIEDIGTQQFRTYYDQRLFSTKAGLKKKSN